MNEPEDYAVFTVAIQLDSSSLQQALRTKKWEESHKIAARMMSCLARVNAYALRRQSEEAEQEELRS